METARKDPLIFVNAKGPSYVLTVYCYKIKIISVAV